MFLGTTFPFSVALSCRRGSLVAAAALVVTAVASASIANAGVCGDDVDGARVACACGDMVVSDTALSVDDPVVTSPCPRDGLFVSAPSGAAGITLDLSGLSIIGQGVGAGIRVLRGGADGAVIVGGSEGARAQIAGFQTGIAAAGSTELREVRNVDVVANDSEGLRVRSTGLHAADVTAARNGRSGVRVTGHGATLEGVEARDNAGNGIRLHGSGASVDGVAEGNAGAGAVLSGRGHDVSATQINDNGGAGVQASGQGHSVDETKVSGNAAGAISGRAGAVK